MREDDPHRAAVEYPLDISVAALIGHSDKRGDSHRERCAAQRGGVLGGECRMLQVNEDGIITCGFG